MIWSGFMFLFICVTFFPKDVLAQTGLDCPIHYLTINEVVPYCGVSSWLEWNCAGANFMDTIERKRAVCCTKGKPHDECMQECNMTANYDIDITTANLVCPFPGFTLPVAASTITSTVTSPTMSSTKVSIRTTVPSTSVPTTTAQLASTTTAPSTSVPTTTAQLASTTTATLPTTTVTTKASVSTSESSIPVSMTTATSVSASASQTERRITPTVKQSTGLQPTITSPKTYASGRSSQLAGVLTTWDPSRKMSVHKDGVLEESDEMCSFALWTSITSTTKAKVNVCVLLTILTVTVVLMTSLLVGLVTYICVSKEKSAVTPAQNAAVGNGHSNV